MPSEESSYRHNDPSHPSKADLVQRGIGKAADLLIAAALAQLIPPVGFLTGLAYLLVSDGLGEGQSPGKRFVDLQTVLLEKGNSVSFRESILRNVPVALAFLCFSLPYIGWLLGTGILLTELLLMIGNPEGRRLGDEIAQTRVIHRDSLTQNSNSE